MEAIESVEATGRLPREAVLAGNATLDEPIEVLPSCEPDVAACIAIGTGRAASPERRS